MSTIKTFEQISKGDVELAGGKGLMLALLSKQGFAVPEGFILTNGEYSKDELLQAFDHLNTERVAVRSSAIAEDSVQSSWAGQLETYLNVTRNKLIESVEKCRASMHSERAREYARRQGLSGKEEMAVVVQKMINSEVSGVMFSVNPVTKNRDEIMIEAVYGLGELLVSGKVNPDNYILDKHSLEIKSKTRGEQEVMMVYKNGGNSVVAVPGDLYGKEILSDDDLKHLGKFALQIEEMTKRPQDMEWAKEKNEFFIVQSRPITTL